MKASARKSDRRLANLILYVLDQVGPRDVTWLLNTLYLIDLEAYVGDTDHPKGLSGKMWLRGSDDFPDDPVPEGFMRVITWLVARGDLKVVPT